MADANALNNPVPTPTPVGQVPVAPVPTPAAVTPTVPAQAPIVPLGQPIPAQPISQPTPAQLPAPGGTPGSLPPIPAGTETAADSAKKDAKPKVPVTLNPTMILYAVIFVLLILVIALAGLSISLITNGGVNVQITPPATTTPQPPTDTDDNDTTPPPPGNNAQQLEDLKIFLSLPFSEVSAPGVLSSKYPGTVEFDSNTFLVPFPITTAGAITDPLIQALDALINQERPAVDSELIVQFQNPIAESGINFEVVITNEIDFDREILQISLETSDSVAGLSTVQVELFKAQFELTASLYQESYRMALNGDPNAYMTWGE